MTRPALLESRDGRSVLCAPTVGWFRWAVQAGDAVAPGRVLGRLQILNRVVAVIAPEGARGVVLAGPRPGRVGVEFGQELLTIGEATTQAREDEARSAGEGEAGQHPVLAPIDGIFYCRPSPDAPPFVSVGDRVVEGTTLGLVEVMKTFNPVRYGGIGAPPEGVIAAVEVVDQAEVRAGQVLFRIE